MAAVGGGGEGGERWWRPSLMPKRKRWTPGEFYKQRTTEEGMCGGRSGDKKTRWESESPMDAGCRRNRPMPARLLALSLSMGFCIARFVTCELRLRSVDTLTDSLVIVARVPSGQSVTESPLVDWWDNSVKILVLGFWL
jgi:hypothetical protein